jgi:hypothetical protein
LLGSFGTCSQGTKNPPAFSANGSRMASGC